MTRSRPNATVRTSAAPDTAARAQAMPSPARAAHPDVAVVTTDVELAGALRAAVPDVLIMAVEAPNALADLLLSGTYGVLVTDVPALGADAPAVLKHLAAQFPDIPIVAVGTREEEALVAGLISAGQVYRYLHRPVSPERARTFLEAALRRHAERAAPAADAASPQPALRSARRPSGPKVRRPARALGTKGARPVYRRPALILAAAALAALALLIWLNPHHAASVPTPRATVRGVLRPITAAPAPEPVPPASIAPVAPPEPAALAAPLAPAVSEPSAPAAPHARRPAAESPVATAAIAPPAPNLVIPSTAIDLPLPGTPPEIGPLPDSDGPLAASSAPASDANPPAGDAGKPATEAVPAATDVAPAHRAEVAPLVKVVNVPPVYPLEARVRGTEGWVDVHFTVSTEGLTDNVRVTNSSPRGMFDHAAIDAVSRWRYAPRSSACEVDERIRFRF
ncbi:MAG TPA: TonB family protein [Steroidobacteraceae bacterium]|nr:TonB family protein [Steroidobacteraceae bacterium]